MANQIRKRSRTPGVADPEHVDEHEPNSGRIDERPTNNSVSTETGGHVAPECSAKDAKYMLALVMILDGSSQKEIAEHFGVDPRTIRNWMPKIDKVKLGIVESIDPTRELERLLVRFATAEDRFRTIGKDALARSDYATAIRCEKELKRLAEQRVRALSKLGVFDRFTLPQASTSDPNERAAEFLADMIQSVHANVIDRPDETSQGDD